jgi:hypothetical protein
MPCKGRRLDELHTDFVVVNGLGRERSNGNESPFRENSEVPFAAEEIVTLEPVALSVVVILLLVPTTTPAKFSVTGTIVN